MKGNNRYDVAIKNALGGSTNPTTTTQPTTTKPPTTTTTSTNPGSGSCAGVPAWSSAVAYNGGSHVTYKFVHYFTSYFDAQSISHSGHLWTNSWWSQADTPGGMNKIFSSETQPNSDNAGSLHRCCRCVG